MSCSKDQDNISSTASKSSTKLNASDKYSSIAPSNNYEDDLDDFDPRGTSNASKYLKCCFLWYNGCYVNYKEVTCLLAYFGIDF